VREKLRTETRACNHAPEKPSGRNDDRGPHNATPSKENRADAYYPDHPYSVPLFGYRVEDIVRAYDPANRPDVGNVRAVGKPLRLRIEEPGVKYIQGGAFSENGHLWLSVLEGRPGLWEAAAAIGDLFSAEQFQGGSRDRLYVFSMVDGRRIADYALNIREGFGDELEGVNVRDFGEGRGIVHALVLDNEYVLDEDEVRIYHYDFDERGLV